MSTIGILNANIRSLRAASRSSARASGRKKSGHAAQAAASGAGLRHALAARLSALEAGQPGADEEAVHAFVDLVLSREFGADLVASGSGQDLLAQVRQAMLCSPDVRKALLAVLQALRQSGRE